MSILQQSSSKSPSKQQRVVLSVMGILLIFLLILLSIMIISSAASCAADSTHTSKFKDVPMTDFTVKEETLGWGELVLVNSTHEYKFPKEAEENLQNIPSSSFALGGFVMLNSTALDHAVEMAQDMTKAGLDKKLFISSSGAYRSYKDQQALTNSATKAGFSDHHSGMLLSLYRVYNSDNDKPIIFGSNANTEYTGYATWLVENSYKYGFIQRFPASKSSNTGVSDYEEAFRYVGLPHAKYIHDNGLCLEEYIEALKTSKDGLDIKTDDGCTYHTYYVACNAGDTIKVPANDDSGNPIYEYTISGTNDGGVVITVKLTK